ncbi:hypothetical protein [Dongia sp. agr-C8]
MVQDWLKTSFGLWMLTGEMTMVMTLRGMKMAAGGPAAAAEFHRMVTEKVAAGFALQARAWSGQLGSTLPAVVDRSARYYHRRVRANRRRLTRF